MGHIEKTLVGGVTVFSVVGRISATVVLDQIVEFLTNSPTRLVIWDILRGDLSGITSADWRMIIERAGPLSATRAGGRTAIVSDTDLNFGMSRMFQSYAEGAAIPFNISVFRTREAAQEWLAEA